MFGNKKEKPAQTSTTVRSSNRNIIDRGTQIIGNIISEGDFRIDGTLEGTLKTKGRVIVGKEGYIEGDVECSNADVEGTFSGEFIVSNTLTAKSTAVITGSVTVGQISTEPGAKFNATCNMKGANEDNNLNLNAGKKVKIKE